MVAVSLAGEQSRDDFRRMRLSPGSGRHVKLGSARHSVDIFNRPLGVKRIDRQIAQLSQIELTLGLNSSAKIDEKPTLRQYGKNSRVSEKPCYTFSCWRHADQGKSIWDKKIVWKSEVFHH
jgi:hypothetical protein